jgi:hypothetical protein
MLLTVALVLLVSGAAIAADESDTRNSTVGGSIPELCQISITGNLSGLLTLTQDGTGEPSYDAGYVESATNATVVTVEANKKWALGVNYSGAGWSCPGSYDKDEADLQIKITNVPTGTVRGGFGTYTSPTDTKTTMLDHTAGVANNAVNIQTKVVLDWTKDIPGAYSIVLVYTMETAP